MGYYLLCLHSLFKHHFLTTFYKEQQQEHIINTEYLLEHIRPNGIAKINLQIKPPIKEAIPIINLKIRWNLLIFLQQHLNTMMGRHIIKNYKSRLKQTKIQTIHFILASYLSQLYILHPG